MIEANALAKFVNAYQSVVLAEKKRREAQEAFSEAKLNLEIDWQSKNAPSRFVIQAEGCTILLDFDEEDGRLREYEFLPVVDLSHLHERNRETNTFFTK